MTLGRRRAAGRLRVKVTIRDRNRRQPPAASRQPPAASRHAQAAARPAAVNGILDAMAEDLRVNNWLVIPAGELHERFSRSSGPGGQSVNTTDSRVELSFDVAASPSLPERERARAVSRLASRLSDGVITVAAEGERSQLMNRDAARARLTALLREAIAPPPPPRVPTKPTRGAKERRLEGTRRRAQIKRNRRFDAGGSE
jgi:ribosome-associated protein